MDDLRELPGIGPKLAADLRHIGIQDGRALAELGVEAAIDQLSRSGLHDCAHARRALEKAVAAVSGWGPAG